jgi:hypothetical protein
MDSLKGKIHQAIWCSRFHQRIDRLSIVVSTKVHLIGGVT